MVTYTWADGQRRTIPNFQTDFIADNILQVPQPCIAHSGTAIGALNVSLSLSVICLARQPDHDHS